ncbi:MAG TPA: M48 family metallopeptidase [Thermoanaerobaculia bacterium]|nr:M48 family metallopeptidase [Thermoanaerobaculia bacterium]
MDFFARQEEARQRSRRLVVLFAAAVAGIVATVYLAVRLLLAQSGLEAGAALVHPPLFAVTATVTLLVIATGSLYKSTRLARGGPVIAQSLGGRPVQPNSSSPAERRLLNVVEEMALASGIPVPSVYLLEQEEGINAFAAGLTTGDAVVAVTRGALERLSRDELQGVIGHEFSHILNGDMRLNVRLAGLLHGILVIALAGYWTLRVTGGGRSSSGGGKRGAGGAIALFGLALLVVGYVGVFFGRLIQAAVSRQREFLADSAAVQFTRNPAGLAGALRKIGGLASGSRIRSASAEEASHFFFADGIEKRLLGFLSTHPPLAERIARLDPAGASEAQMAAEPSATGLGDGALAGLAAAAGGAAAARVTEAVGRLDAGDLDLAAALLSELPPELTAAAREPLSAQALVLGLLLDRRPEVRERQLAAAAEGAPPEVTSELARLEAPLARVEPRARLPLVDLAVPALRRLSPPQHERFARLGERLIAADQRIGLFEFALQRLLARHLGPRSAAAPVAAHPVALADVTAEAALLLSALAWCGGAGGARAAFAAGAAELRGVDPGALLPRESCGLAAVDKALGLLDGLPPSGKRALLAAAAATVSADREATAEESELLRAIADALGCPLPPLALRAA